MAPSPEALCNDLARSRLLPPDEIRKMHKRWLEEAGGRAGDMAEFTRWLVARRYVTDYQLGMLERGHGDKLFLDQYTLVERIAKGRMAGVYKAVHRLGPSVAIKILPPSKARNPQLLARFQREARLALALKHPNVVRTFQMGESDGLHFLVMEYLEGETLDDVLRRRGKLPPAEAVRLLYQALLGLQHLHEQGLVHRDLKPANLMLVPGPREVPGPAQPDTTSRRLVKIVDIGTGRALFADDVDDKGQPFELTSDGEILGTPDYMAPEQARDPHAADIRADVYSLGCVLYHALAGQPPFPDTNLVRKMVRHATEAPAPPRNFNPEVPDGLQQIVGWMLAKDPAQRYPTPERAAQALQVFLAAGSETFDTVPLDPGMHAYLQWLEKHGDSEVTAPELPPVLAPTSPSPGRKAPAAHEQTLAPGPPSPAPARKAPAAPPTARPGAHEQTLAPAPLPKRQAAPRPRKEARRADVPVAQRLPDRDVDVEPVALEPAAPPGEGKPQAPGARNWTWLIVALVAGLLIALLVCGGIAGALVHHWMTS